MIRTTHDGWTISCVPGEEAVLEKLDEILPPESRSATTMRDDYRSFVGVIDVGGRRIIAKSPRLKNANKWIRFTTIFRPGEALAGVRKMWLLRRRGVNCTAPIMAMEKRRAGMIVDSWMFYEYVHGVGGARERYPEIVDALRKLHDAGWIHGDPHIENFIWDGRAIHLIDFQPKRAFFGRIAEQYDFIRLKSNFEGIENGLPEATRTVAYRIAALYERWILAWRRIKKGIRGALGIERAG